MKTNKKVFVGMSGGVDSSVSAALLKEQGFSVVGVHLKCWNVDGCADQDAEDARRAAEVLDIPFYVFDFEQEYKDKVVSYMVEGYRKGVTPNPDVMCNHEIKFGLFFERAMKLGADYVATGHYARVRKVVKNHKLLSGLDKDKDQSYFLWLLTQKQLSKTLFPIGGLKKAQVRKLAKKYNLPNAEKKDSQGVCFLGEVELTDFLKDFIPQREGLILDEDGKVLGQHKGVHNYTIGQRHGLQVGGLEEAHYVAEKDLKTNTLVLTPQKDSRVYKKELILTDLNFINQPKDKSVCARFRYRQKLQPAKLEKTKSGYKLTFQKPQSFVAPGQSAVFYSKDGKELLGGGIIKAAH